MNSTVDQAYEKYIVKVEKNATNDGLSTDKARFVLLFNEEQNRFIENLLDKRGDDDIRYIQNFLKKDKKISTSSKYLDSFAFPLPADYLDFSSVYANVSRETCTDKRITLYPLKDEDSNQIIPDTYTSPSFKWRESWFTINSNNLSVYTDDFSVDNIILSYYRYPNKIGQLNPNDSESPFIQATLEWDDKALDRIITLMVSNFLLSEQNPAFQAQKQQSATKQ